MRSARSGLLWVAPSDGPLAALRQAVYLLRAGDNRQLARSLGRYAVAVLRRVYRSERLVLNEIHVESAAAVRMAPPVPDLRVFVIRTREDLECLVESGYENVAIIVPRFFHRIDSGAIAACAFVGHEFASIDWMAFSPQAKLSFDRLPYRVDFENGEACTGGAWTSRRYRRRGIGTYRFSVQMRYMRNRGCRICRNAIEVNNIPSKRGVDKHGGRFRRVGHYRRILWREFWHETPVD